MAGVATRVQEVFGAYPQSHKVTSLLVRSLVDQRGRPTNRKTLSEFEHMVEVESIGELRLKGFAKPVPAFNIKTLTVSPLETLLS